MTYQWLKALHIIFMVTWFAGLFYLPRLFIYHAEANTKNELDDTTQQRFITMQRKLFIIMSIGMMLTILLGLILLAKNPSLMQMDWLQIKLLFVAGLIFYHFHNHKIHRELREGKFTRSSKWLRFYNEVPALFLFVIIIFAVVKPF